jgi:hypothetical protein
LDGIKSIAPALKMLKTGERRLVIESDANPNTSYSLLNTSLSGEKFFNYLKREKLTNFSEKCLSKLELNLSTFQDSDLGTGCWELGTEDVAAWLEVSVVTTEG